ncbi:hypothetical protein [Frankia sp. R82]|uniref:hypothetical protein n=1 Tax=Frankia sp. R82 TaxID=2950553 RepID=UPI0020441F69|nr:hypothetical protein [Frankia sp. R82]MCM3883522.1 hypothetical protein [Frankia sp. R82]
MSPDPILKPTAIVETSGGHWQLIRTPQSRRPVAAFFQPDGTGADPESGLWSAQGTVWQVEEQLGFPLPHAVHRALQRSEPVGQHLWPPPEQLRPVADLGPADVPDSTIPRRFDQVHVVGGDSQTYGRLMHGDQPMRSWQHGRYRLDLHAVSKVQQTGQHLEFDVAYRVWTDGLIAFAGDDLHLAGFDPFADEALRHLAGFPRTSRTDSDLTARQADFLAHHATALTSMLLPPTHPYPPGTRISAQNTRSALTAVGTVVDTARNAAGDLLYLWRPDVYDLPGHPYRARHHGHTLVSPHHQVEPTLEAPDTAIDGPDGSAVLTYGSRIRTIDHPGFHHATVLRARLGPEELFYDVLPDRQTAVVQIPATDVVPVAGTAWPTTVTILEARTAAQVPLKNDEIIVALRELTTTISTPFGPMARVAERRLPSLDAALDPHTPDVPAPEQVRFTRTSTRHPSVVSIDQNQLQLVDPTHGFMTVQSDAYAAALTRSNADLTQLLTSRQTVALDGSESHATLAALTAIHFPDVSPARDAPAPDPPVDGPTFDLDL